MAQCERLDERYDPVVQRCEVNDRAGEVAERELRPAAPGRDGYPRKLLGLDDGGQRRVAEQRLRDAEMMYDRA